MASPETSITVAERMAAENLGQRADAGQLEVPETLVSSMHVVAQIFAFFEGARVQYSTQYSELHAS